MRAAGIAQPTAGRRAKFQHVTRTHEIKGSLGVRTAVLTQGGTILTHGVQGSGTVALSAVMPRAGTTTRVRRPWSSNHTSTRWVPVSSV